MPLTWVRINPHRKSGLGKIADGKAVRLLFAGLLLACGCYMTNLTTARTVGAGKVGLTGGGGVIIGSREYGFFELPLLRVDVGLAETFDLALQTGACIGYPGGWFGGEASCKWKLIDDPGSVTLSVGGGFEYFYGPAVNAHIFVDSNLPYLPLYVAVKPRLHVHTSLHTEVMVGCDLSAGIHIDFSECFRLILDSTTQLLSYGWGSYGFGLGAQVVF
jgi:hypothetical protein